MGRPANIAEALLEKALLMETTGPTLPTELPNQPAGFNPPADGKYLSVSLFPNGNAWEGLNSGSMAMGLLGVMVVWPKGLGEHGAYLVADLVATHFAKGTILTAGGTKVKINREPVALQPLIEDDRISVPVNISWESPS